MRYWATQDSKYEKCLQGIEEILDKYNLTISIKDMYDPELDRTFHICDRDIDSGFNAGYTGGILPRTSDGEQLKLQG